MLLTELYWYLANFNTTNYHTVHNEKCLVWIIEISCYDDRHTVQLVFCLERYFLYW